MDLKKYLASPTFSFACRALVGAAFLLAGVAKFILPLAELEGVVRAYQAAPEILVRPVALVLPWVEMVSGALLLAGLYRRPVAWFVLAQLIFFVGVTIYAAAAGANLDDCGCFGGFGIKESPEAVLARDAVLIALIALHLRYPGDRWALDQRLGDA